ncbi:MAG: restriction endonuclease subunit S [Acholeplasmatales bacterium]|nr:restriction endonuclease subunit S [Acholeplasmatales bacterium]
MKYSEIKWIGEIPENWNVRKVKQCFYISKEQAHEDNPTILSLARAGVKVRDISNNEGQLAASYDNYNPVMPGDLLLNPMDLYSGANCSLSEVGGVISPAYINLRKKVELNPKFYDYYFKTQYWAMAMFAHGKGVSFDNRWTMNAETLLNYYLPFPSSDVQDKIVDLINKKTAEIDSLIEIENQQIEKLKEYKQAVITEAVTKGLDKNATMKDSGVEWIGKIPEGWNVKRAKFIAEEFIKGSGITKEDVLIDGDIPCVRYGEIYTKYDNYFNECVTRTNLSNVSSPTFIEKGDLLFTCTGELVEEIGKNVLYLGEEKCIAGGDIIVMKHKQHPGFINYAMNCTRSQMQKSYGKAKLKVVHISSLGIGNVYVCLPSYDEQKNVSDYLDDFTEAINEIILIKQQKIEQLGEYKKSLIYEYVTGKKEVIV